MTEPAPPRHLSAEARRLWRATVRAYALEPRHLVTLSLACEALDRCREAQATVAADGPYTAGRFGLKAHPALAIERDSRIAFMRAVRELGLDLEPAASRPPTPWRR
ncbi:MAG TPA: P27 family phage terminase small subunit [Patescibacteria group bacterium]|nr:P27 family phage terminase small subunit [Patescibacteria group bacterium]